MARTGQQLRRRTAQSIATSTSSGSISSGGPTPGARRPAGLRARLRYRFDATMERGTPALIGWLTATTLLLILVFAVVTTAFSLRSSADPVQDFPHELFSNLLHALDPGTIGGDAGSWRFLLTMLALTIAGLFIVSALIGVIAAGIDARLAELRRGRSVVLEHDHTVVLGWSDSIFTIINELTLANESRVKPVVVVLADRDKVEMEDDIRAKVPDLRGTRVICRSGSPMDIDDLRLSSHPAARSVILLAPEGSDDPDSEVIKTLLALTHEGGAGPGIVAEIRNPSNLEAARLVGTERTVLLDIRDTVAKLLVQTSRQSGAAAVYIDLFDYDGDEIYFLEQHTLGDLTFAEAQLAFEAASVIGLVDEGRPVLNPAGDMVVGTRSLILVTEDDGALGELEPARATPATTPPPRTAPVVDTRTEALVIGWNERAPIVLRELDTYAAPGSVLTVLTSFEAPVLPPLRNIAVTVVVAPTTDRATLDQHVVPGLDQVMVLCYSEDLEAQAADARTLVTLLHVRDILGRNGGSSIPVVSEMLDDRNRVLAQVAHVDDVVVSGEIVSLLVTQLSEDPRLEAVFDQLLGEAGSEIYLRPVEWYVEPGSPVDYVTVVAAAVARGETALGYASGAEVSVNPAKSTRLEPRPGDRVVVLAES